VKDAHEVVDRRVLRPLLVEVVELVQLGDDDPAGKRKEEEQELRRRVDDVARSVAEPEQKLRADEGEREPEEIRGEQHARDEPAAAAAGDGSLLPLDQLPHALRGRRFRLPRRNSGRAYCVLALNSHALWHVPVRGRRTGRFGAPPRS
jgi:hypothetical protein